MERHFTLPLVFAAALHAALLFAFPRVSTPPPASSEHRLIPLCDFFPRLGPETEPDEPENVRTEVAPRKGDLQPRPPEGAEPPAVDPGPRPTMEVPIAIPGVRVDSQILPHGPAGDPSGSDVGGMGGPVIDGRILDRAPVTRLQVAPLYPPEARRDGLGGEVLVEFVVDESGRVLAPRVVRSSHRQFEEPALRAVARWQFEPGRRNGRVVRFHLVVPLVFSLNGE